MDLRAILRRNYLVLGDISLSGRPRLVVDFGRGSFGGHGEKAM
jgi:hypothetical protein